MQFLTLSAQQAAALFWEIDRAQGWARHREEGYLVRILEYDVQEIASWCLRRQVADGQVWTAVLADTLDLPFHEQKAILQEALFAYAASV